MSRPNMIEEKSSAGLRKATLNGQPLTSPHRDITASINSRVKADLGQGGVGSDPQGLLTAEGFSTAVGTFFLGGGR